MLLLSSADFYLYYIYCLTPSRALSAGVYFKINFFKKFFQEHYMSVKQFGSRSGLSVLNPDLGPNCLQWLSADNISHPLLSVSSIHRVKAATKLKNG